MTDAVTRVFDDKGFSREFGSDSILYIKRTGSTVAVGLSYPGQPKDDQEKYSSNVPFEKLIKLHGLVAFRNVAVNPSKIVPSASLFYKAVPSVALLFSDGSRLEIKDAELVDEEYPDRSIQRVLERCGLQCNNPPVAAAVPVPTEP